MFMESPNDALGMLIELRNPKYGKSKKHICRVILFALSVYHPVVCEAFLDEFIENGCWVDILWISKWSIDANMGFSQIGLRHMANSMTSGQQAENPLAAKWAPNEKSKWNRAPYYLANKLMMLLGMNPKEYRHKIVELRKKLNIVETNMSTKQFADINFAELTITARKNYANSFERDHNSVKQVSQDRIELSRRYTRFLKGPLTSRTEFGRDLRTGFASGDEASSRTPSVEFGPYAVASPVKIDYKLFHAICEK